MYRPFDISVKKGEINKRGDKRKGETIMQRGKHVKKNVKRGRYKQTEKEKTKGKQTTQRAKIGDIR